MPENYQKREPLSREALEAHAAKAEPGGQTRWLIDSALLLWDRADAFARVQERLEDAKLRHSALRLAIDEGDDTGEHVGLQQHRRAVYEGQAEILKLWQRSSLGDLERALQEDNDE